MIGSIYYNSFKKMFKVYSINNKFCLKTSKMESEPYCMLACGPKTHKRFYLKKLYFVCLYSLQPKQTENSRFIIGLKIVDSTDCV